MYTGHLSDGVVTSLGSGAVSDTTSETTTAVEDMQGFDGIRFVVAFGDVDASAVLTLQPKENTASSTSSPTPTAIDISNGAVSGAVTAVITTGASVLTESSGNLDNLIVVVDVKKNEISKRYVFLSITAATESYEIVSIITERYHARELPVTIDDDNVSLVTAAS